MRHWVYSFFYLLLLPLCFKPTIETRAAGVYSGSLVKKKVDYTIELSENRNFFRVRVKGQVTTDLARQWNADLEERNRSLGIKRFLFDVRSASNVSSIIENYLFAYEDTVKLDMSRNVRSAILISEGDQSHDFIETAFRNAGYNVRIFNDESSAVKWLGENIAE